MEMPAGNLDSLRDLEARAGGNRARSLDQLVADLVAAPYVRDGLARAEVLDAFPDIVHNVLGPRARSSCRAIALRGDALIVETTDSIWSQKVSLAAEKLLAALVAAGLDSAPRQIEVRTRVG